MRTIVFIRSIAKKLIGELAFRELLVLYPEGYREGPATGTGQWFDCTLPQEDPRLSAILGILAASGHVPGSAPPGGYRRWYWVERAYDKTDIEAADLLVVAPRPMFSETDWRDEQGRVELELRSAAGPSTFGSALHASIVKTSLKSEMESAGLIGVAFRPTVIKRGKTRLPTDEFWELTSTLQMPPLSPRCILKNNDGVPFDGDYDKGCFLVEDHFADPEYHYTRPAVAAMPPFDLAVTRERFGNGEPALWPADICSKRFYQFCRDRRLKVDWIPVRIDPDPG